MASSRPALTLGIEEEYLLVDPETRSLASRPPAGFMRRCEEVLGPRVTHEFLQSQVEVGTSVCRTIDEALNALAWEAVIALGIVVVLAPFGLVAFAAWLGLRLHRRREEERLLAT